jgi:FMN phosphatase YigB (HAD superfamily)
MMNERLPMQLVAVVGSGNNLKITTSMMRKKRSTEWRMILSFVSIGLLQVLILKSYSFVVLPSSQKSHIQMNSRSLLFSRIDHNTNQQQQQEVSQELSLLSFDLDDTLFSIGDVVRDANNAMIKTMIHKVGHDITMDIFLENTISIRKVRNGRSITYRDLRKFAIRQTFERSMAFQNQNKHHRFDTSQHMDSIVEDCYTSWVRERHISAERYLFPDAIDTLRTSKEMFPNTCFAAIPNGAGDPLEMTDTLAPYFDFRISGEDEDISPHRKPHRFIYQKALKKHEKIMLRLSNDDENRLNNNNEGVWCHGGDCVANDVGASADCGTKAIWMCLDGSDDDLTDAVSRLTDTNKNIPNWSTATKDEIEKRAELIQQGKSKMAASIRSLSELPDAIRNILESCDYSNPI